MGEGDQVREHQAGIIPSWTFYKFRSANGGNHQDCSFGDFTDVRSTTGFGQTGFDPTSDAFDQRQTNLIISSDGFLGAKGFQTDCS